MDANLGSDLLRIKRKGKLSKTVKAVDQFKNPISKICLKRSTRELPSTYRKNMSIKRIQTPYFIATQQVSANQKDPDKRYKQY